MKSDALEQMKAMLTAGGRNAGKAERALRQIPKAVTHEKHRRFKRVKTNK